MTIHIRSCGHSVETSSRAYVKNPDKCVTCAYIAEHGDPKRLYVSQWTTERRQKKAENMKKAWKAQKQKQGPKNAKGVIEP